MLRCSGACRPAVPLVGRRLLRPGKLDCRPDAADWYLCLVLVLVLLGSVLRCDDFDNGRVVGEGEALGRAE